MNKAPWPHRNTGAFSRTQDQATKGSTVPYSELCRHNDIRCSLFALNYALCAHRYWTLEYLYLQVSCKIYGSVRRVLTYK